MPITKIFMLPSIMANTTNEDMWISVTLSFIIDIFSLIILLVVRNKTEKNVFTLLSDAFGKVGGKIILVFYFIFFMLKAIVPINEQKDFIEFTLYFSLPSIFYFMPFYITAFYISIKKIRVLGRCADILWTMTIFGVLILIAISISNASLLTLLPIGANGAKNILTGTYQSLTWFGDSVFFVFFLGNYKNEKKSFRKILLSYVLGALMVILFMIIFYGVFTSIAFRQRFALTEIAKYTNVINNTGRLDYILIVMILCSHIIAISMPIYFASSLLQQIFSLKRSFISPIIVVTIHAIITLFFKQYYYSIENISINYMGFIYLFFSNVLPISLIFLTKRRKTNAKTCQT